LLLHRPPSSSLLSYLFFFFSDSPTSATSTLSLHDALPIWHRADAARADRRAAVHRHRRRSSAVCPGRSLCDYPRRCRAAEPRQEDRKSTRLNSSHLGISYAVFCLKKKNKKRDDTPT